MTDRRKKMLRKYLLSNDSYAVQGDYGRKLGISVLSWVSLDSDNIWVGPPIGKITKAEIWEVFKDTEYETEVMAKLMELDQSV